MFLCYYVAWPFRLDSFIYSASRARPTYQFWLSKDCRLLSYELLNLITFLLSGTVTGHAPCHVTYHRRGEQKWSHFWNPWPQFVYSLCHFRALRRRLSHVIGENSVFPIVEATKLTAHAQYHVTCASGVPKTTRNNFNPKLSIHYTTFMGDTMTINGSFILAHPHVKAIFGWKKNLSPVKIGPQNGSFS